jgi:hypothetical protein
MRVPFDVRGPPGGPASVRRTRSGACALGALTLLSALSPSPAAAQTLRDFEYSRPLRGERALRARVEFAAGTLILRPGPAGRLYQLALEYDAERFRPIGGYDAAAGEVRLGVEGIGGGGIRVDRRSALPQTALVELAPAVDLALDVAIGAAEGSLELGGLRLAELDLKNGASRTTVSFSGPNPGSCAAASVSSGAGEVTVTGLGNSGCRQWRFDGGVGAVNIDLGGAWPADGRIALSMALGGVTLRAPRGLGLRVTMNGFLADFDAEGFSRSGKTYTSAGYEKAPRRVEVEVNSAMGGVTVEWR